MAGLQSCLRNVVVNNSLRLTNINGVYLQSSRGRHILVFQTRLTKNIHFFNKSKLLSYSNLKYTYRLASTNIPPTKLEDAILATSELNGAGSDAANGVAEIGAKVFSADVNSEKVAAAVANDVANPTVSNIVIDEASLPPIPTVEDPALAAIEFVSTGLKEPSFQSLGLGSSWPSGLIQQFLEGLHIGLDMPWWAAITAVTIIFRLLVFPLNLKSRRNSITMNNHLPQLQILNVKLTEARQTGNYYEAARYAQELQSFMKDKGLNPMGSLFSALVQAPIFISMFLGLKGMANAPVESMKVGGLFWFQDLTVPDPYYILPVASALTFLCILELGAEGSSLQAVKYQWIKYVFRALPFVILPFTINFPGAILWYWSVSNCFTLCQVAFLKIPPVSRYFNLPKAMYHDPDTLPIKKKGAIEGIKEGMANARITRELEDRERLNTMTFEKAGKGPVPRTFKKNPKLVQQKTAVKLSGK